MNKFKTDKTVGFTFQWLWVQQWINSPKTARPLQAGLIRSQLTSNSLRVITYSSTKPWITVHFNLYKLKRCTPAAEHANDPFLLKTNKPDDAGDTFGILYYFIISQFSMARPRPSPPGLILLPRSPLKHHLHVYLCSSLPAVISQPGDGVGKTN